MRRKFWWVAGIVICAVVASVAAVAWRQRHASVTTTPPATLSRLATATAGTAAATSRGGNGRTASPTASIGTPTASLPASAATPSRPQDAGATPALRAVTTFRQLQKQLADKPQGVKLTILFRAAAACKNPPPPPRPTDDATVAASQNRYYQYFTHFCETADADAESYLGELQHLPSDNPMLQVQMLSEIDDDKAGKQAAVKAARQFLRHSRQAPIIKAAAQYLIGEGAWDLGADSGIAPGKLREAQWLGVQMYACRFSGGCGSGGYMSMTVCGPVNRCLPGITADAVWRYTHSPEVYQLARRIDAELLAAAIGAR